MSVSGDRIRKCRLLSQLTQEDVANRLGIGKQAVYKYEIGTVTNIPLDNLEKMAEMFHTTPAYLAGWTDQSELPYSQEEIRFVNDILSLNDEGKRELLNYASFLKRLSEKELFLLEGYNSLSAHGQDLLLERVKELQFLYGKKPEDSSAESV